MSEGNVIDLKFGQEIQSKPFRFARNGYILVAAFKAENKIVVKDLSNIKNALTKIITPDISYINIGQKLLMVDPIFSAQVPDSPDRVKVMYHFKDTNFHSHPHRTFLNEIHLYRNPIDNSWGIYYFDKVI